MNQHVQPIFYFKNILESSPYLFDDFKQLKNFLAISNTQIQGGYIKLSTQCLHTECTSQLVFDTGMWIIEGPKNSDDQLKLRQSCIRIQKNAQVWIKDFTIINQSEDLACIEGGDECRIWMSDCTITSHRGHGMRIQDFAYIDLFKVWYQKSGGCGLFIKYSGDLQEAITTNQNIHHKKLKVEQCTFSDNGQLEKTLANGEEETDGVWYEHGADVIFTQCHFHHNMGDGLYVKSGHVLTVHCTFTANDVNGLYYGELAQGAIHTCSFHKNKTAQIGFKGARVHLKDIKCTQGEGLALFALDESDLRVEHLYIKEHKGCGILIDGSNAPVKFEGDFIKIDSCQDGLITLKQSDVTLRQSHLSHHSRAHLSIADECTLHLENVHMNHADVGIIAQDHHYRLTGHHISIKHSQKAHIYLDGSECESHWPTQLTQKKATLPLIRQAFEQLKDIHFYHELNCHFTHLFLDESQGQGVILRGPVYAKFSESIIRHSKAHQIDLKNHARFDLIQSEVSDGQASACFVQTAQCHLQNVRINHHKNSDIVLHHASYAEIKELQCSHGKDAGLYMLHYAYAEIKDSIITHHKSAGVWLEDHSYLWGQHLTIQEHHTSGSMFIRDRSQAYLNHSQLKQHKKAGIDCVYHSVLVLLDSIVEQGDNAGIMVRQNSSAIIKNNKILKHQLAQIAIQDSSYIDLQNTIIAEGQSSGLLLEVGSHGDINGVWIYQQVIPYIIHEPVTITWENNIIEDDDLKVTH